MAVSNIVRSPDIHSRIFACNSRMIVIVLCHNEGPAACYSALSGLL